VCELKYWVAVSSMPGVGSRWFFHLKDAFGDLRDVWRASEARLRSVIGPNDGLLQAILGWRARSDPDRMLERLLDAGVEPVTVTDERYPSLLAHTVSPPPVLYCIGALPGPKTPCVSVVGTRRPTPYGCRCAAEIASALARAGFWVVSGMAKGIDSISHKAAMDAGGHTVAVLGCGPDVVYPRQNRALYDRITDAGAVVSEYYLGTPPLRTQFPARNRIVSGISVATVVVQAGAKSGALITARFAAEQGRSVHVVPGDIYSPASLGGNLLLYDGASPVVSVDRLVTDLCDGLKAWQMPLPTLEDIAAARRDLQTTSSHQVSSVLAAVQQGNETVDAIARQTRMSVSSVLTELSLLELEGRVIRHPSGSYGVAPQ
jgi:DNA processing protein